MTSPVGTAGRLLMLGGSSFLGRAVVAEALRRGFAVTTFNRGTAADEDRRVEQVKGDRHDHESLGALRGRDWDIVVDTWDYEPSAVLAGARLLDGRVGRYVYVSTEAVYDPLALGVSEDAPVYEVAPDSDDPGFPLGKAGSEVAVRQVFGDAALILRPGLVLGPHENVGRLLWWLSRIADGGEVLAPGPADQPLQLIDSRDLATFLFEAVAHDATGPFNVVSRRGHATMGSLLEACVEATGSDARLTWVTPEAIADTGITPFGELPIWVPPGSPLVGLYSSNVERAHAAGLRCRPIEDTVADTWAWLRELPGPAPLLSWAPIPGYDRDRERRALADWHAQYGD